MRNVRNDFQLASQFIWFRRPLSLHAPATHQEVGLLAVAQRLEALIGALASVASDIARSRPTLCYAIVPPGQKSGFRAGIRSDSLALHAAGLTKLDSGAVRPRHC